MVATPNPAYSAERQNERCPSTELDDKMKMPLKQMRAQQSRRYLRIRLVLFGTSLALKNREEDERRVKLPFNGQKGGLFQ